MTKSLTIGSKIFVVHKEYSFQKKPGGAVNLGRIISFRNQNGVVQPVFRMVGQPSSSRDCTLQHYDIFTDIDEAIKAIQS